MVRHTAVGARREKIVLSALIILFGGGIFLYFLLIGGGWFLGLLATVGMIALIGLFHYLLWGRSYQERHDHRQPPRSGPPPTDPLGDAPLPVRYGPPD